MSVIKSEGLVEQGRSTVTTEAPEYIPGPRKITLEEYRKRSTKPKKEEINAKPKRGGKRAKLFKEIHLYKELIKIAASPEEHQKYTTLLSAATKELNRIRKCTRQK